MPAERGRRVVGHAQITSRESRPFTVQRDQNTIVAQLNKVAASTAESSANGISVVAAAAGRPGYTPSTTTLAKKAKQELRQGFLMRRLGATTGTPYSKSHIRRVKRRAKGELSTDLVSMEQAIAAVEAQDGPATSGHSLIQSPPTTDTSKCLPNNFSPNCRRPQPGQIGEGKHASLTISQRKRALQLENLRHKLIIADRRFTSSPFQTIRAHAQNTLLKHQSY